jgi:hypothetical protein
MSDPQSSRDLIKLVTYAKSFKKKTVSPKQVNATSLLCKRDITHVVSLTIHANYCM